MVTALIAAGASLLGPVLPPLPAVLGGPVAGVLSFLAGLKAAAMVKMRIERHVPNP